VYYLLAGVMAGNIWEAWRRANLRSGKQFPRGIGGLVNEMAPWN
jgi:hypothetical protein